MTGKKLSYILFWISVSCHGQQMQLSGSLQDTTAKTPLRFAVIMAVNFKDSTLVKYSRSDEKGEFKLEGLPIDTYLVIISHPRFSEREFFLAGSKDNKNFNFGKMILPPINLNLKEVVIYAFKDPVYFKGDTLIFTADSFKVKRNATVEDLLRKLPGLKVDAQGKITTQGKSVEQVLVDGDEFFGSDPTVATRNLNANSIDEIQVYDKKKENAGDGANENIKVINLKLKEDAKQGYFGKTSAAGDFKQFYEGDLLANKFKGKQKISVFGTESNTPKSGFSWDDMREYGLEYEKN